MPDEGVGVMKLNVGTRFPRIVRDVHQRLFFGWMVIVMRWKGGEPFGLLWMRWERRRDYWLVRTTDTPTIKFFRVYSWLNLWHIAWIAWRWLVTDVRGNVGCQS